MFAQKVEKLKLMLGLLGVVCPFFILNLVAQKGVAYKKKSQIATNFDSPPPPLLQWHLEQVPTYLFIKASQYIWHISGKRNSQ